jgi:dihydroorotase
MATLSIIGGRVIDPASNLDLITDLHIAEERIIAIGSPPADFSADKQIDATGQIVCPGLIDLSVRLREPGAEEKGTIFSETRAAAANGITTVCCPPDTDPVIDSQAVAELLQQRAAKAGMAKVLSLAALTEGLKGQHLANMGILKGAGCIAVSNVLPIVNTEVFRYALEYAASCDLLVFFHAKDPWLGNNGYVHEGAMGTRLGLSGIPEATETIEVARDLLLIEMTGVRAHFCQLSSARAVDMIKQAQAKGLPVTADVSAHHLFLSEQDINNYNTQSYVFPPLRTEADKQGLQEGLLQGTINAICSDHQPHEADAKLNPFSMAAPGISGLDTLLPLTLQFAEMRELDLMTALSYVTHKPAQILGLDVGNLAIGHPADICIFDPESCWRLSPENMRSKGHNSPFLEWEFKGEVSYTVINGRIISD